MNCSCVPRRPQTFGRSVENGAAVSSGCNGHLAIDERPLSGKATGSNGSKAPAHFFQERTLKSEAPITSPSNRH